MRTDGISAGAAAGAATGTSVGAGAGREHSRLVDAAQQFEAMLLQEMLKPLQSDQSKWTSGDTDGDKSGDTLSSYGTEAVAKAISKAGGLGIAKRVVQQVTLEHASKVKSGKS